MPTDAMLPLIETLAPADQAAVAVAVRTAAQTQTPIYPIGGGTWLGYGVRPTRPGIGLSLAGLNRVIDYPADDLTITVEAGVTLAELARQLDLKGQRLPIDVACADRATVGGAVAVNAFGPRLFSSGTMRDYVLGLSAVDGRGTAFAAGGRVVKNAAGLNLCRLLTGALGTLGVVTQVTLMVRPKVEASALVICDLRDGPTAEKRLASLVQSKTRPMAIELLTGPVPQDAPPCLLDQVDGVQRLLVGFEGSTVEVDWMAQQLLVELRNAGLPPPHLVPTEEVGRLWGWLTDFDADLRIHALPSKVVPIIEAIAEVDAAAQIRSHAGNGVISAKFAPCVPSMAAELLRVLRPRVEAVAGRMIVLRQPDGESLDHAAIWGPPCGGAVIARAIRERFDPQGILNPGRM